METTLWYFASFSSAGAGFGRQGDRRVLASDQDMRQLLEQVQYRLKRGSQREVHVGQDGFSSYA